LVARWPLLLPAPGEEADDRPLPDPHDRLTERRHEREPDDQPGGEVLEFSGSIPSR